MKCQSRMTLSLISHMRPSSRGRKSMASLLATTKSSKPGPSRIGRKVSITSLVNQHPSGTLRQEKLGVKTSQRLKTLTHRCTTLSLGGVTTALKSRLLSGAADSTSRTSLRTSLRCALMIRLFKAEFSRAISRITAAMTGRITSTRSSIASSRGWTKSTAIRGY